MRKLKLQMQISLDGFNSTGPNDEQKWVTWAWDEIRQDVLDLAGSCDTELIGKNLAMDYIPFWADTLTRPESMMHEVAKIKAGQKKIVFTKTLEKSLWQDAELARGDLKDEVMKLKSQDGKDMIVYGGSALVADLVKEKLIDEFYLFVNPIALGQGVSVFGRIEDWQRLKLIKSRTFDCGIILLQYERQ
jgi:dihydrofolate reductase